MIMGELNHPKPVSQNDKKRDMHCEFDDLATNAYCPALKSMFNFRLKANCSHPKTSDCFPTVIILVVANIKNNFFFLNFSDKME